MSILAASIAGSVHCVGMCGGLMLAATGTRLSSQFIYHGFRLLGYLLLGGLSGYLGNQLFYELKFYPLQVFLSTLFLLLLLIFAMSQLGGSSILSRFQHSRMASSLARFGMDLGFRLGKSNGSWRRSAWVGFFTVFLPCGWLYSFVLLSVATHHPFYGAMTLVIFWLGTLPALMSSRILIQSVMARLGISGTRAISVLMIAVAFFSVLEHWKTVSRSSESPENGTGSVHCTR